MKEYKLSGWPELPPAYQRTAYRDAVQHFLAQLSTRGVLIERSPPRAPLGAGMAARSMAWLRRTLRV
jgi:hypothetical protein